MSSSSRARSTRECRHTNLIAHLRARALVSPVAEKVNSAESSAQPTGQYFGAWTGQKNADPGNTDETAKFPSVVALVWRWTGDERFRDEMYDFATRNLRYIVRELDADGDGWPEGLGNVEREGMGPEKLDNAVYFIRGLFDLADLARAKGDGPTRAWAVGLARDLLRRFEAEWWMEAESLHADSLSETGVKIQQRHWITATPMEGELTIGSRPVPGVTTFDHGTRSLALHETPCFSGERPYNRGLFHTGCGGGPTGAGELTIFGLNTAIQSVGEGNYGRLAEQRRYTEANIEPMFSQPYTADTPDEQPGALPEIMPSPGFDAGGPRDANIERCWTCRAMFLQPWGHYGTAWPVVHQHLGVRPDLGRGTLEVVPQLPPYEQLISGRNIRLGEGAVDVVAADSGRRHRTAVETNLDLRGLTMGHTVPRDAQVTQVLLDGAEVRRPILRETNRGLEVLAEVPGDRPNHHVLVVVAD